MANETKRSGASRGERPRRRGWDRRRDLGRRMIRDRRRATAEVPFERRAGSDRRSGGQRRASAERRSVRASDAVARLGGDQFALLLAETGPEAAGAAVRKLQHTLQELAEETGLPLTVSGGVVTCLQPAESLEAAIGAADRLLHGAKAVGRDTFWSEVIMPQPIEGFEPTRLRRAYRVPPGFDLPMPPSRDRPH